MLFGLHRRQQRGPAGCRDGRGRQARTRVGVPGRIGLQVALADAALVGVAHAVDDGGVGLQQHADLQAVGEHARHAAAFRPMAGFLFDDGRQHQRFIGRGHRQVGLALGPGVVQDALAFLVGAAQQVEIGAARREDIGIGKEQAFRMLDIGPQAFHQRFIADVAQRLLDVRVLAQRLADLAEGPAFQEGDLALGHVAARHAFQQQPGGVAIDGLVAPGLDQFVLLGQPRHPDKTGLPDGHARGVQRAHDGARAAARVHHEIDPVGRQMQGSVHPAPGGADRGGGSQHEQQERPQDVKTESLLHKCGEFNGSRGPVAAKPGPERVLRPCACPGHGPLSGGRRLSSSL
ncbi:hypothetical protein LMG3458_05724 [Achromobacter deleyi]|uniref:Uncharacterized protein n=1 Tax=Achromobacter deleyi TaxID=1353891 RepID=A0A6S7C5P5_9BURK|nr:hypothetical protein LMG3458_05724 [Achromobacter deleyi]